MDRKHIPVERWAAYTIVGAGALLFLRFFLSPLCFGLLPFACAWALAYITRPLAFFLHKHLHWRMGICHAGLVLLLLGLVFSGLFFALRRASLELLAVGEGLLSDGGWLERLLQDIGTWGGELAARFPFLAAFGFGEGGEEIEKLLMGALQSGAASLGDFALRAAGAIVGNLPLWLLTVLVTVVSAFYFAVDLGGIHRTVLGILPPRVRDVLCRLKDGAWQTAIGYLRAYSLLMLIMFAMLCVGFLILGVQYAVLLSALFAFLDFMPVIGMEMLLLPWAVVMLSGGNWFLGFGLIVLYAVITVARQFIEPKIVGHHIGLHPIIALLSMYLGLQLFGFLGMLLLPVVLVTVRCAAEGGEKEAPDK